MTKDARQGRKADDRLLLSSPQGVLTLAVNEPFGDPGVAIVNPTKDASAVIANGTAAINPTEDSAVLGGSINATGVVTIEIDEPGLIGAWANHSSVVKDLIDDGDGVLSNLTEDANGGVTNHGSTDG